MLIGRYQNTTALRSLPQQARTSPIAQENLMEHYLKPTEYCDCNHQDVISKAEELTKNDETLEAKASSIFYFVRDRIPFQGGLVLKASETLKAGNGYCVTKSNLQVALLRAINIPARYHVAHLKKDILRGVISKEGFERMYDIVTYHPWCECYLAGKWISCDALFDESLVKRLIKEGIRSEDEFPTIDWDGKTNLNTATPWIIEDKGTFECLDELFTNLKDYIASGMEGVPPSP
jgi:transglutaminase-like putative cysteine protease